MRFRAQTFLFPEKPIGPVFYNEMFFTPDGHEKFGTGFNENRFGFGARYSVKNIEANFFLVRTYIKKPDETNDWPLWAQIQIVCRI